MSPTDPVIVGFAAPFGTPVTHSGTRFCFAPGCFAHVLRYAAPLEVDLYRDHDHAHTPLASARDRTLALCESAGGLYFAVEPLTSPHLMLAARIQQGQFTGCSISHWKRGCQGHTGADGVFVITHAALAEISLVSRARGEPPAFPHTWVRLLSARDWWRIEAESRRAIVATRDVVTTFGDRQVVLTSGITYELPAALARTLVADNRARPAAYSLKEARS